MKKILILTAGFGEGHNAAARNLRDGLKFVGQENCEVEIVDLFEVCYGKLNDIIKKGYLTLINQAPWLWKWIYGFIDKKNFKETNLFFLKKFRQTLEKKISVFQPSAIVVTYPLYNYLIAHIYKNRSCPFLHITIITDAITINSVWYKILCDYFVVANEASAAVLRQNKISEEKIKVFGFPVPIAFAEPRSNDLLPDPTQEKRVLFIINSGRAKAVETIKKILELKDVQLTVTIGRRETLKMEIESALKKSDHNRINIIGWTSEMPHLLLTHHIVISKAGGATTQEAIAASCPMIVNQIVPGQEEGNLETILLADAGVFLETPEAIRDTIALWFSNNAARWHELKNNITKISAPRSSIKTANFILNSIDC